MRELEAQISGLIQEKELLEEQAQTLGQTETNLAKEIHTLKEFYEQSQESLRKETDHRTSIDLII